MERGKRATKINLDGIEEGGMSSLSSCLSQSQSQGQNQTEAETELGQGSKFNETSVNDLPPEMWMEIFTCVDIRSLFNCRLVNHLWSELSSGILHQRSDAKIVFYFEGEDKQILQRSANRSKEEPSLKDFLICMKKSKNPPFARFIFFCGDEYLSSVYSDFFDHEDWKAFLAVVDESNEEKDKNQNQRIKIKSLEFRLQNPMASFEVLNENLRDLLLKKIPNLEELGLGFSESSRVNDPDMKLFPGTVENKVVQLPHLKTIHFNETIIFECPGILKDLLNAAVNLKKIHLYRKSRFYFTKFYDFLQPLGKFHLLKSLELNIYNEVLLKVKACPDFTRALFKLQVEELELGVVPRLDDTDHICATNVISSLFESNKNSLKILRMSPLGVLRHLQFPRFKNLIHLKLKKPRLPRDTFFNPGVCSLDIFPAVRKLGLPKCDWSAAFPDLDSIPVFPRVQNLIVNDNKFTQDSIRVLSLLCPNLKHLKIYRGTRSRPQINFYLVGRAIWTEMQQLESLEVDIDLDAPGNNLIALDSCFTGISLGNVRRLCEMSEAKKTLEERGFQSNVSESELTAEREHPSILDMPNLKRLKINPWSGERMLNGKDVSKKLTWISQEYAFKLLPHLELNGRKCSERIHDLSYCAEN